MRSKGSSSRSSLRESSLTPYVRPSLLWCVPTQERSVTGVGLEVPETSCVPWCRTQGGTPPLSGTSSPRVTIPSRTTGGSRYKSSFPVDSR